MLLTIKGLGAQYIFKTCLRDGTPSMSDLEFINRQRVRPYLRKKGQQGPKRKKGPFSFSRNRVQGWLQATWYQVPRKRYC